MMAGLPCVLCRGVAVAEQVQAGGAGLSVEPEPAAIAAAMTQLISDAAMRSAMALKARKLALDVFSAATMTSRLIVLYNDIARPGRVPAR